MRIVWVTRQKEVGALGEPAMVALHCERFDGDGFGVGRERTVWKFASEAVDQT